MTEFTYRRRVQFSETDASGLVYFANYFRYVDEAEHAMWRAAGLNVHPRDGAIAWPCVAASFEYRKPLFFEDEVDVHLKVAARTRKAMRYSAVVRKDGELVAEGSRTIVCVRMGPGGPMHSMEIPHEIAATFQVASTP